MADTRQVTATILKADGTPWEGGEITYTLMTPYATTATDTVLQTTVTGTADADGIAVSDLAVPDSDAWQWKCIEADGNSFYFNLAAGAPTTLEAILADLNLSATVSASTLSSYLHLSNILDEDDMASDSAVYPSTQQATKAYVDSQVVASGVDTDGSPEADDFVQFVDGNTLKGLSLAEFIAATDMATDSDLTTHTGDTSNPHSVTPAQLSLVIGTDVQAHDTVLDNTTASFTTTDETKLDNIEALADVTDATNVAAAGALMTSGGTMAGNIAMADNLITRPVIKDYGETINNIGPIGGGSQDIDLTVGNVVSATVDTSTTTFTFSNPSASGTNCSFTFYITNGGSQTINWPASVKWAGGTEPTLTASGIDILTFTTKDGGTTWYGFAAGLDMS